MSRIEILRVAAEGGELSLHGELRDRVWWYAVTTDERSLPDLVPEVDLAGVPLVGSSPWVRGWDAALEALDRYPWAKLTPRHVHADYRDRVLDAVAARRGSIREWQRA